ncbi:MAG: 2-oxoacid:ferredoxin oxidoreductase subunit beta [Candidatus Kerfeldbacteria bacterium]|nr:2-oxoacid:ferredoxin oxidoreductase subunit beta [Candidatus Kerfeldbacteria bacterium]
MKLTNLQTTENPDWCPGCGDFGILMGIKKALIALERPLHETCIVSGIGCSGKLNHFVNTYGFEGIHGRALPLAAAVHLANHKLNVVAVGGDGDGYGIGMAHFMHAMRRNMDMTYIVHNNQVYGLTKGQYSPTTEPGMKTSSSPFGAIETPVNPIKLALASEGISFIARGFAGDIQFLHDIILAGMKHNGFALIDVLQPCVTFNKLNTYEFFKSRVYRLDEDTTYDNTNKKMAMERCEEWDTRIATGIFYQVDTPTYEDSLPAIAEKPLVEHDITNIDITPLFKEFM